MKIINIKNQTHQSIQHILLDTLLVLIVLIALGAWTQVRTDLYEHQEQGKVFDAYLQTKTAHAVEPSASELTEMTTEEYICTKAWDCKTAIAIAKAESGLNAYAINKNTDKHGSLDLGCWQLNEKWQLKPKGITRAEAFDCKKSTDIAFQIYKEWDNTFSAWSAYKNNSYLKKL